MAACGIGLASVAAGDRRIQDEPSASGQDRFGPDPWIELDQAALYQNLETIRRQIDQRPVMAVIKANAYGHGLVPFASMLQGEGMRHFAVAKVPEAMALREAGVGGTILSFGPYAQADLDEIVRHSISQTVFTDQMESLNLEARRQRRITPVQVNIDTGLGRVGVPWSEALPFLQRVNDLTGLRLEGVFTALTEDEEFDRVQLDRFLQICGEAERQGVSVGVRHAASSAALMGQPESYLDMVRPGIAVYGHYPSQETYRSRPLPLEPVLSLKTHVMYVKTLQSGESVSYHRAWVAQRPTRVATLPVGYSDGYPPTVAGRSFVLIRGRRYPVIAMVTSNHVIVNLGDDPLPQAGDEAVLVGSQGSERIEAQEVADAAGVSVYKLLIGLAAGLPRRIV
jgi:alanine racemase